jgi:hypothetical protein
MATPRLRGTRRASVALLALVLVVSGLGAAFLPAPSRIAVAKNGQTVGDSLILAGPGGDYGILTSAPAGSALSIDGDPVAGFYPVTFDGISGWTAASMVDAGGNNDVGGDGNGGGGNGGGGNSGGNGGHVKSRGNGGVDTVTADPTAGSSDTPVTGGVYGPGGSGYSEDQIVGMINEAADNYGQSRVDMLRVARCESGLDPQAVGGGGAYYGLYQFVPSTFAGTPYGKYDIFDPWANANAAGWMWAQGKKDEWVCQ